MPCDGRIGGGDAREAGLLLGSHRGNSGDSGEGNSGDWRTDLL